jgi:hypothetical protein
MSKKNLLASALFFAFLSVFFVAETNAQTTGSREYRERFVVQSVRLVLSAQMTYQSTVGQGMFGTLAELRQADMIDAVLASGNKYGYGFTLSRTHATATSPPKFSLKATPQSYPKAGRRSFYIDETGEMRGADKEGAAADATDPIIDDCASFGIFFNERCVLNDLRVFWGAQMNYQSTTGAGLYGSFSELLAAVLINSRRASGTNHGYAFTLQTINPSTGIPAFFSVKATPVNYGVSGRRSFYIDINAVVRGGDQQGQPADENDPPINE